MPNCTDDGYKDVWQCNCDRYYLDEECTKLITDYEEWKTGEGKIPAIGHDYVPTIIYTDSHVLVCKKDKSHYLEEPHNFVNNVCKDCGHTENSANVIIKGINSEWITDSTSDLSFTSSAAFISSETEVKIDENTIENNCYTLEKGPDNETIVNLKASYLKSLSLGKHWIHIVSRGGGASTYFTINKSTERKDNPETGDSNNSLLWFLVFLTAGTTISAAVIYFKKSY